MIAGFYGATADLSVLRRDNGRTLKGSTLAGITACCASLGLSTRAVRCDVSELAKLQLPCILHWRFDHFVVLQRIKANGIVLHDPARGVVFESLHTVSDAFTGIALEVTPAQQFHAGKSLRQLRLADLLTLATGIKQKFCAGMMLALVCEALVLATPFYLQIVIDQVLGKGDRLLLNTLVVAFSILLAIQVLANVLRQLTFSYIGHVTVFDLSTRVLRHLLKLPIRFFRDRELGDIQYRVQSLGRVQAFLVQSVPALVLDAIFIILITILMMIYELRLTFVMLGVLGIWCVWRLAIIPISLRYSSDVAQADSSVQTHFLASLRAVQTIKVVNGEAQRESQWRTLFAEAINARIRASNLGIVDAALRQLVFQSARIAVVYLLAVRGIQGQLSIGMISAFVAYVGMFTTRGCGIVDRLLEFKLLDVPVGRLSDIVFSEEESDPCASSGRVLEDIELRNVSFSYAREEPDILKHCSAHFRRNGFTAIAGPSGVGKSSLLQLIAGNEKANSGEILLSDCSSRRWSLQDLRAQLAAVFQGDSLLQGTVADNIALFDASTDMTRVREAATLACIAPDISALPMAYETRIGDLGSSFSRGQVQRILLARAFYRRPKLLLLDEATSGLDADLERDVIRSLCQMSATRIVVTHSDLMLQSADSVLWLHEGRLVSSRPERNVPGV